MTQSTSRKWTIVEMEVVPSTNDAVRAFPPWTIVRARRQSAGRGRHGRAWISAEGGLWMSAAMPVPEGCTAEDMTVFGLCTAEAVANWLLNCGVTEARVRWPNDILAGKRKLGGVLCELLWPERFILGLGMNVANAGIRDGALETPAAILAEWLSGATPGGLVHDMADLLGTVHDAFGSGGREAALSRLNIAWRVGSDVSLEWADGRPETRAQFVGVNDRGWPVISDASNAPHAIAPPEIHRLREV